MISTNRLLSQKSSDNVRKNDLRASRLTILIYTALISWVLDESPLHRSQIITFIALVTLRPLTRGGEMSAMHIQNPLQDRTRAVRIELFTARVLSRDSFESRVRNRWRKYLLIVGWSKTNSYKKLISRPRWDRRTLPLEALNYVMLNNFTTPVLNFPATFP